MRKSQKQPLTSVVKIFFKILRKASLPFFLFDEVAGSAYSLINNEALSQGCFLRILQHFSYSLGKSFTKVNSKTIK